MTPEQQRIAIAEICGWKEIRQHPKTRVWFAIPPPDRKPQHDVLLPDYLFDLNAMHEAEMWLRETYPAKFAKYLFQLRKIAHPEPECATVAQRAETWLKAINLWKN